MRKLSIELPKHRLFLHFRVVKRRNSVVQEALLASIPQIKKKYHKGTLITRYFRHIFEHKSIKKALGTAFTMIVVGVCLVPQTAVQAQGTYLDENVITVQNSLITEKNIQYPLEAVKINQGFSFFHPAVDLGGSVGDSVKPVKAGRVIFAGFSFDGYGSNVVIDHGNGLTSLYAHLSKIEVKDGEDVDTNTEIGELGRTGHATGPHLHLEIRTNGKALNPLTVLSK